MLKVHVVQAEQGDCLILQAGASRFVLIDGGPKGNGLAHLVPALTALRVQRLELAILSHVDNDHVLGLLEFLADVRRQRAAGRSWEIAGLWHNAFSETVGGEIARRLTSVVDEEAARGYREGGELAGVACDLRIPINPGFTGNLVAVESQPDAFRIDDLKLRVVAPDGDALARLKRDWEKWLGEAEEAAARGPKPSLDTSPTNRSSIVVLAECDGRTALLTGDARHDEIQEGLIRSGISKDGCLHVHLLKVQHHGSNRNTSREFFAGVTADKYVVSANGRDRNPDIRSLEWLVDAAYDQRRRIQLFVTNAAPAVLELARERPPEKFGYDLQIMKKDDHVHCIDL